MNEALKVAISKSVKTETLDPGEYKVDALVRIKGTVKKGEDYDSAVYQSIPFDQLFAVAMSKLNGVTVESIVKAALADETDSSAVKDAVKDAIAKLTEKSVKRCSGKTTAKVTAEVIGLPLDAIETLAAEKVA